MEYTQLGRTGLKVSRLCLGTMNFGPRTTEEDSFAIMDKALELDINFFDTANTYGWKLGEGWTEQIVGRWFAQGGGRHREAQLGAALGVDQAYGLMDQLEAQRPLALKDPAEGPLPRLRAPRRTQRNLEAPHQIEGQHAQHLPGAVRLAVVGRDRVEGELLLELA